MAGSQVSIKDGSTLDETPPDYMAMIEKILAEDRLQSTARRFSPLVEAIGRDYGRNYSHAPTQDVDVVAPPWAGERIVFKLADGRIVVGTLTGTVKNIDGATTFEMTADCGGE